MDNFRVILSTADPTYLRIAGRTLGLAAAVTITDALLAFPLGYFMARIASPRLGRSSSCSSCCRSGRATSSGSTPGGLLLGGDGALNWALGGVGLHSSIAFTNWAMWIVFSYVWLPFMVLPVYAALERIPDSYLEASGDLGAKGWRTFRSVILPLALPGVIAGSIFTFSLTLGDFITPLLVGGASSTFIGNVVYDNVGVNSNVPFAAAFATVPVVIMAAYLLLARRLGAFEAL